MQCFSWMSIRTGWTRVRRVPFTAPQMPQRLLFASSRAAFWKWQMTRSKSASCFPFRSRAPLAPVQRAWALWIRRRTMKPSSKKLVASHRRTAAHHLQRIHSRCFKYIFVLDSACNVSVFLKLVFPYLDPSTIAKYGLDWLLLSPVFSPTTRAYQADRSQTSLRQQHSAWVIPKFKETFCKIVFFFTVD